MLEMEDIGLTLFIIFIYFLGCITGFGLRATISRYRRHNTRKAREVGHARLAPAEGELRHDGNARSIKLLAVVTALVVVSGVIVFDHFNGPLFLDLFYCLNDGGAQTARMCIRRVPL
jgi:hypothetical protein